MLPPLLFLASAAVLAHAATAAPGSVYVSTKANTGCSSGDTQSVIPGKCIRANTVQAPEPGTFDPDAFHEYALKKFATCPDGKPAEFILYEDSTCRREQTTIKGSSNGGGPCQQVSAEFRSAMFSCPNLIGAAEGGDSTTDTAGSTATTEASEGPASTSSTRGGATTSSAVRTTARSTASATDSTASTATSASATTRATGTAGSATAATSASSTAAAALFAVPAEWAGLMAAAIALI